MLLILTGLLKLCIGGPLRFKPHPSCFEDAIENFTESVLNCVPPAPPSPFVGLDFSSPKPRPRRSSTRPPSPKSRCRRVSVQQKDPLESEDDTYDPFTFPYTYDPSRPLPPISRPPGFPLLTREMLLPADWFPAVDPDAPRQEMPVWNGEGLDDILAKPSTTSSPTPTPTPAPAPVEPVEEVQQVDPPELETAELDDSDSDDSDYSDAASSLLEDSDCPDGSETSDEGDASDECGEFDDTDDEDSEDESEQDDSYNESSCDEDASVTDAEEATTAETQVADAAQAFEADVAADEQASASTAQTVPDQDTALSDTETDAFDALPEPFSIPLRRTAAVRWPQTSDSRARRSPNSPPRRKKLRHFARGIGSLRDKRGIEAVPRGESDIDDYIHKHDIMYPFYEPSRIRNADSEVDDEPRRPAPRRKNRYQTLERSRPAFKRSRTRTYRATSTDTDSSDDEDEVCDSSAPQRVSRVDFLSVVTRLKTRLSFLAAARKRFNRLISVTLYGTAAPEATAANENDAVGLDSSLDGETAEEAIAHETTQFTFTPPDELPNNLSIPVTNEDPLDAPTAPESTLDDGAKDECDPIRLADDSTAVEEDDDDSGCVSPGIDAPAAFQLPAVEEAAAFETEEGDAIAAKEADASTTPTPVTTWSTSWALVLVRRRPAKRRSSAPPAPADTPLRRRRSRGSKRPRTTFPDVAGVREKRKFEEDSTSFYCSPFSKKEHAESSSQTLEGGRPAQKRPRQVASGLADDTTDNLSHTYIRTSPRPLAKTPYASPRPRRRAERRFPSRTPPSVVTDLDAKPASPSPPSSHTARQIGDSWRDSAGFLFKIDQYGQQRRLVEVVEMRQVHKMRTGTDESIEKAAYRVLVERWVTDEEHDALRIDGKLAWQVFERDQQASTCAKANYQDESCTPAANSLSLPLPNEDSTRSAASPILTAPYAICPDTLPTPSFEPSTGADLSDLSFDFVPTVASFAGHGTAVATSSSPEGSASKIAVGEQAWMRSQEKTAARRVRRDPFARSCRLTPSASPHAPKPRRGRRPPHLPPISRLAVATWLSTVDALLYVNECVNSRTPTTFRASTSVQPAGCLFPQPPWSARWRLSRKGDSKPTFATRRGFRPSLSFLLSRNHFALRLALAIGETTKALSVVEEPETNQGATVQHATFAAVATTRRNAKTGMGPGSQASPWFRINWFVSLFFDD
ncbi:Salivary gland secretion 1 [Rhodotorula toruloides ATCC 204091]|uniref:Salivary gland secretion 1 n=1 Tax=Rhodotorula toruloides TaxID=5286 RepID=A0A2T0AAB7_RHOTO|nr:Salivary gland secretion 1 [Rhodotorula toruloides ATCC 204091]PRQ74960.1 salivary gland secretion 1 [Rhodotorula toruloides]